MTKAELIEAMKHFPDDAYVFAQIFTTPEQDYLIARGVLSEAKLKMAFDGSQVIVLS